jgi:hypothetical protein
MSEQGAVEGQEDEALEAAPPPRRFCFVEGTHICTLRGDMAVEQLREGEHIRAKKGSFHIVTEVRVVAFDDLDPEAQTAIGLYPIRRGAFDEGLPRRDFYVSAGQQFELSRRLEIAHAVRMAVRKEGAALRGLRFVIFACPGLPMIRAEGIWTTQTPIERAFPATWPETDIAEVPQDADPVVTRRPTRRIATRLLRPLATGPEGAEPADVPQGAPLHLPVPPAVARAATRRRVTRFLRSPVPDPVSEPGSHRTETGTPAP